MTENTNTNDELSQWPYQASGVEFTFVQDEKGWWDTKATMKAERSADGETYEIAEVKMQILDKDHANSIMTCWSVFNKIQQECGGNLFEHKDSDVYTFNVNETDEEFKELVG